MNTYGQINRWHSDLDQIYSELTSLIDGLSADDIQNHPRDRGWSIEQVIEHLIKVGDSYEPIIATLRQGQIKLPGYSRFGLLVRMMGKMILGSVNRNRKMKTKTFQVWEPGNTSMNGHFLH